MAEFEDQETFEDVTVVAETDKALLVRFETGDELWCPLSHVDDDSPCFRKGDVGTIIVSGWWARKVGLV